MSNEYGKDVMDAAQGQIGRSFSDLFSVHPRLPVSAAIISRRDSPIWRSGYSIDTFNGVTHD